MWSLLPFTDSDQEHTLDTSQPFYSPNPQGELYNSLSKGKEQFLSNHRKS